MLVGGNFTTPVGFERLHIQQVDGLIKISEEI
jgi:hypothetical protein